MESSKAALVMDYRFFHNDWDITTHALETAWRQPLGHNWPGGFLAINDSLKN